MAQKNDALPGIDSLWDFNDPAGSEEKFRALLAESHDSEPDVRAEILSQLARTFSMRRRFDEAQGIVDQARSISPDNSRSRVRTLLEQGRILNSAGKPAEALPFFLEAWDLGREIGEDGLAVDAAHMAAIAESPEQQIVWNERALDLARSSSNPVAQRWRASLLNNLGWTYYDLGQLEKSLALFEEAVELRIQRGDPVAERIARYCVGKCLRALGRVDEALSIQIALLKKATTPGAGYGQEEVGECLLALGRADEARTYFAQAYELLDKNDELREEPGRLARLKALGGVL